MTLGKWNSGGSLSFVGSSTLFIEDLLLTVGSAMYPIGTIIAYDKSRTGAGSIFPCWVECNGQTISDSDSLFNGITIPNLNNGNTFLRGGSSVGSASVSSHSHTTSGASGYSYSNNGAVSYASPDGHTHDMSSVSHLPPYYSVVWLLRIK